MVHIQQNQIEIVPKKQCTFWGVVYADFLQQVYQETLYTQLGTM